MRLLTFITALLSCLTVAYGQVDLTRYEDMFQRQASVYGSWLAHNGMKSQLQVETVAIGPDKVKLFLKFASEHPDTVTATWRQLKADFERVSAFTLEERLYLQMLHTFELQPEQAKLLVYDTYDPDKVYCFSRKVYLHADRGLKL